MNINGIDIQQLKSDTDKTKFVELGYITEYPDVTILYIRHEYTKGSNYLLIKHNGLAKAVVKELTNVLKKVDIRIYTNETAGSSCLTMTIMAQPINYKAI